MSVDRRCGDVRASFYGRRTHRRAPSTRSGDALRTVERTFANRQTHQRTPLGTFEHAHRAPWTHRGRIVEHQRPPSSAALATVEHANAKRRTRTTWPTTVRR
jgi:hypothetical protein